MTFIDVNKLRMTTDRGLTTKGDIHALCNAYDEAQREIEVLKNYKLPPMSLPMTLDELDEKHLRISTLEGLLREVLNVEFWGSQCSVCGMPKQILGDGLNIQNHKPDCLFTRIQKELG